MLITLVSAAFLAVLYFFLKLAEKNKRKHKRERQLHGLNVLQIGLKLMSNVQQHRGISAAMLNGEKSFSTRLTSKRNELQDIFQLLESVLQKTPNLNSDLENLLTIKSEWEQLSLSITSLSHEQSFARHTALIRKVIHLLGDMGEHLGLLDGEGSSLALLSNTLLLKLPLLMESIGQARALGAGYAAQGQCGAVGRIRMSFLEQHIRECQNGMRATTPENSPATQRVSTLLAVLNERIIRVGEIDIAPEEFFRTASDAIEACLGMWQDVAMKTENIV